MVIDNQEIKMALTLCMAEPELLASPERSAHVVGVKR